MNQPCVGIFWYLQTAWQNSTGRQVPKISNFESEWWSFYSGQSHISSYSLSQHPREEKDNEYAYTIFISESQEQTKLFQSIFNALLVLERLLWQGRDVKLQIQ